MQKTPFLLLLFCLLNISACGYDKIAPREVLVTPPQKNIFYIENNTCLDVTHTRIRCY